MIQAVWKLFLETCIFKNTILNLQQNTSMCVFLLLLF